MAEPTVQKPQTKINSPGSVPPPSDKSITVSSNYVEKADQYLISHGWEKVGENEYGLGVWQDPVGSMAKAVPSEKIHLPMKGGGEQIVEQYVGPPIPWAYSTAEALRLQRGRDTDGAPSTGTPLERLNRLEVAFDKLQAKHERFIQEVTKVAELPLPTKPEGGAIIKRMISEALMHVTNG